MKAAKLLKILLFFGIGIVILYLVYQRQEIAYQAECTLKGTPTEKCSLIGKIISDISNVNYFWIVITMILFMITNFLRALRWQMMLKAIGHESKMSNLFCTIMINYLANLGIPRSGEVIRAGLVSKYEKIPLEKVLGTIFTDRIFDVLMLLIVMGLAVVFGGNDFVNYLDKNINLSQKFDFFTSNPLWVLGFVLVLAGIIAVFLRNLSILKSSSFGKKVYGLILGFADGVKSVTNVSSISLFLFYTVMIWLLYYFMLYLTFFAFAPTEHLGPVAGLVVFVFGSLGILIPTPGGMGSYHYLVGEALAIYDISGVDAFSFANIVFFSIQVFVNVVFGLLAFVLLPIFNKE